MTMRAKNRILIAGAIITMAAVAVSLLPMLASAGSDEVREIRLVVREMTFYIDGQTEPNPTLRLRAGERVRLVLTNDEPGMRHDFAVHAWEIGTRMLDDRGEADAITFRVPSERGGQTYQCTPHPTMMRGTIRVE